MSAPVLGPHVIALLSAALQDNAGAAPSSPLAAAGAGARDVQRLSWTSSKADNWRAGRAAQGFFLYNDGLSPANIGLSQADVTAAPLIVLDPGTWIALPIATSQLYAGGNNDDGTLLLLSFDYAPTPAAGSIDSAGVGPDTDGGTTIDDASGGGLALARNAARKEAVIVNDTGAPIYVLYGSSGASASNFTFLVPDQATLIIDTYTGDVAIFQASPAAAIQVTEIT